MQARIEARPGARRHAPMHPLTSLLSSQRAQASATEYQHGRAE